MPTYEYFCNNCGKNFEHFQQMSEAPMKNCLCCRKGKVKRQIGTGAGIIFKGSGFYSTDYRSENYRESAKKEKSSESQPEKKTTTATEDSKTTGD